MKSKLLLILICLFCFTSTLKSQTNFHQFYPDSLNKKRLATSVSITAGSYIGGLSFLGFIWYKDSKRVPFHYYKDGKGYLQMDKAGHAFSAYHQSSTVYNSLRWSGLSRKKALIYGGSAGLLFQTPIEIFDGLYENWGFSWGDMLANTLGSTAFTVQEALFNRQLVQMKFSYSPSEYPKYHSALGESQLESFFLDYNAHTYWLSMNIKGVTGIQKIPGWLNFAFGYSGNGMIKEFENPEFYMGEPFPHLERYRQYVFSLDVDFTQIPTKKKWVAKVFKAINMIKVPFPALELNREEGVKFRGLYF